MTRGGPVVTALAVWLTSAGCGFGDDGGETVSQEEYARQADAICLDTQIAVEGLPRPLTFGDLGPYARRYAPLLEKQVTRLRELQLPEGREQPARRLLDEYESTAETWHSIARATKARDGRRVRELLADSQERTLAIRELSQQLDLQVCEPQT